jgi:AAA15 family ATPase/GTPase
MTTHLKGFGLENFRVFKDYTWFDFAPITVLTGTNSSGKSSLIKALLLLENSISKSGQLKLEFSNDNVYQLGNFERIINNKSSNNTVSFYFPYQLHHFPTLGESYECQVAVTFNKEEDSILATAAEFSILIKNEPILIYGNNKLWFDVDFFQKNISLESDEFKINERKINGVLLGANRFLLVKKIDEFSAKKKNQFFEDLFTTYQGVDKGYSEIIEKKNKNRIRRNFRLLSGKNTFKKWKL